MTPIKHHIDAWPRRRNGEPIFRTTNDAVFYAQLASKTINTVDEIKAWRNKAHKDLRNRREAKDYNLTSLMEYATKAQFFRECYEEIERIKKENGQ